MTQLTEKQYVNKLTKREYEVFVMIGLGVSYRHIAEKLSIKTASVSTYRSRILRKMKLKSTNDIIRSSVMNNII